MSKDIWHTKDENPDANVGFACYRNLSHVENCTYLQNGGFQPTGSWAYIKDLLALETENKDLSDKIGKLETELDRTRNALDVAVDAIDVISLKYHKDTPSIFLIKYAQNAKAEITALEQKDVKCGGN